MNTKYRLLDVGERLQDGDEVLTPERWTLCNHGLVVEVTYPVRRPDDGKGRWILCDRSESAEFWKWGVGWLRYPEWKYGSGPNDTVAVWRREREVQPDILPTPEKWVVFGEDDHITGLFNSEKEALDHLDGNSLMLNEMYYIAKVVKSVVVKMIVKEVGK